MSFVQADASSCGTARVNEEHLTELRRVYKGSPHGSILRNAHSGSLAGLGQKEVRTLTNALEAGRRIAWVWCFPPHRSLGERFQLPCQGRFPAFQARRRIKGEGSHGAGLRFRVGPSWPRPVLKNEKTPSLTGFPLLARQVGVEPTTVRLTVGCSATELLPNTVAAAVSGARGIVARVPGGCKPSLQACAPPGMMVPGLTPRRSSADCQRDAAGTSHTSSGVSCSTHSQVPSRASSVSCPAAQPA